MITRYIVLGCIAAILPSILLLGTLQSSERGQSPVCDDSSVELGTVSRIFEFTSNFAEMKLPKDITKTMVERGQVAILRTYYIERRLSGC